MKKQIESARVEIEDLVNLGWELDLDDSQFTLNEWHVLLKNNDEGKWMWEFSDRYNNAPYHPQWAGDDEMTESDVARLLEEGKLWDVEYK